MVKKMALIAASFALLGTGSVAFAQDDDTVDEGDNTQTVYKNNQEINFEGLDVQGEIKKPQGAYLLERKKSKFSPLIKFRQNFDEEVTGSLEEKK